MAFFDDLTEALRTPPGLTSSRVSPPPEAAWDRWRRTLFGGLQRADVWLLHSVHAQWADPASFRRHAFEVWCGAHDVLDVVLDRDGLVDVVDEVLRRYVGGEPRDFGSALMEREVRRLVDLRGADHWPAQRAARYLVEIGALDESATRRLPLGDLLLSLGASYRVVAMLHAECLQSTGADDGWRYDPGTLQWVLNIRRWCYFDVHPDLWRLHAFGLAARDEGGG